jgi:hypothetical protein
MTTLLDVLIGVWVVLFLALSCVGVAVWPVVIVSAIVMLCQKKDLAEAGHVYAACIGSFVGAPGLFVLWAGGLWAGGVGSEDAWAFAAAPFLLVMPFSAGAVLGTVAGIAVWTSVVRIANWRERRIAENAD